MKIKPIRNDDDLRAALRRLDAVFQAKVGTPEADEMEVLVTLIEAYENKHYPISPPDPVEAIAKAWDEEITRRMADMEAGRTQWTAADEVMTRLRTKISAAKAGAGQS